jgi:apolipoprotein N-acyltransferase
VPLLLALEGRSLSTAFVLGLVTGCLSIGAIFYWILLVENVNLLDYLLLDAYLGLYGGLFGLGLTWVLRRTRLPAALVAPALWVTLEYLRSHLGFLALPWMLLGHSQYLHPWIMQIGAWTGAYGLSFLIVLVNVVLADVIRYARDRRSVAPAPFPARATAVAALLLAGVLVHGAAVLASGAGDRSMRVAVVQGNVGHDQKWEARNRQAIFDRYAALTRAAVADAPRLVIWPETAIPGDVRRDVRLQRQLGRLATEANVHLLVGAAENAKFTTRELVDQYYNAMFLISPEGRLADQYKKVALVPFGEYAPLREYFTWPKMVVTEVGRYVPGDRYTVFSLGGVPFATVICWETIFPDLVRQFVARGARFMVVATNEAQFLDSAAPYQLLAMTAFRAAENRVAVARAANTGVTALIDPFGRITQRLRGPDQRELFVEGVLTGDVPIHEAGTFYTHFGDVFALLQIVLCLTILAYCGLRRAARPTAPVLSHSPSAEGVAR